MTGTCKHRKPISGSCPSCERESKSATIEPGFYWMMQSGVWTVARVSNIGEAGAYFEVVGLGCFDFMPRSKFSTIGPRINPPITIEAIVG